MIPELRIDPLTGLKVALTPGRAARPESFELPRPREGAKDKCPLCGGHEDWTPPESYAIRPGGGPADSGGWQVRSVPNKYPVLAPVGAGEVVNPPEPDRGEPGLFVSGPAHGFHEVIVHTPDHVRSLADLTPEQFQLALRSWRDRVAAHSDAACIHLIVNEGPSAGASLEHTHSQLYALSFVPAMLARERERFTAHNARTMGGCLLCDLLQEEVRRQERIVAVNDDAVLLCPYASRSPYELQLVPRKHAQSIVESEESAALLVQEGLAKLKRLLGGSPPLNLWLRTAPRGAEHFHWRIDVVPRLSALAGMELGAGIGVNVYPPERAAADLSAA